MDSHSARTKMEPQSVQSREKRRFGGPDGGFLDPFLLEGQSERRDEGEKTAVVLQLYGNAGALLEINIARGIEDHS